MPRQMRDVERESLALQMRGEAGNVVPFPVELPLGAQAARFVEHPLPLAHHRRDRESAIAADEGRHALQQKRLEDLPVIGNRQDPVGMRMQIDKARRDCESGRIDLARAGCARGVGRIDQRGNLAILDCDVGLEARRAAAVDDDAVANDYVIFHARDYSRVGAFSANGKGKSLDLMPNPPWVPHLLGQG